MPNNKLVWKYAYKKYIWFHSGMHNSASSSKVSPRSITGSGSRHSSGPDHQQLPESHQYENICQVPDTATASVAEPNLAVATFLDVNKKNRLSTLTPDKMTLSQG